jgi:hypothetical protein
MGVHLSGVQTYPKSAEHEKTKRSYHQENRLARFGQPLTRRRAGVTEPKSDDIPQLVLIGWMVCFL